MQFILLGPAVEMVGGALEDTAFTQRQSRHANRGYRLAFGVGLRE